MYEDKPRGGKKFLTILVGLIFAALATGSATAQVDNPTLSFTTSESETTTGSAAIPLILEIPGGSFVSALQFDVETDNVTLVSITASDDLDDFVVDSRTIASGATRVIAYAESGKLTPKTYDDLFTINVSTTGEGTVSISNVIGAEDSDFGQDANVQLGTASHELTLALAGDANGDYQVDLADVAQEIDAVYDGSEPGSDLYPWGNPDGQIDVRDLLILVRAVLAGEWPDGSPLNAAAAGKTASGSEYAATTTASESGRIDLLGGSLNIETSVPIKVLMVMLHGAADIDFEANAAFDGTVMRGIHTASGALRVMFYRLDGGPLAFEEGTLGRVTGGMRRLEAEAVSAEGLMIPIESGMTSVGADHDHELPESVVLTQNYPNPFNPTSQFELVLPETQQVEVAVFNLFGQRVATLHSGVLAAGTQTFRVDGAGLSSGQYFYRAQGRDFHAWRTMTLMK